MIPADIKEMAKHDELVAELLATGGPFFFKDFKRIRAGDSAHVLDDKVRKATWATVFFLLLWIIYSILFVMMFVENDYQVGSVSVALHMVSVFSYGGIAGLAIYQRARLNDLMRRIDAGEFSTD